MSVWKILKMQYFRCSFLCCLRIKLIPHNNWCVVFKNHAVVRCLSWILFVAIQYKSPAATSLFINAALKRTYIHSKWLGFSTLSFNLGHNLMTSLESISNNLLSSDFTFAKCCVTQKKLGDRYSHLLPRHVEKTMASKDDRMQGQTLSEVNEQKSVGKSQSFHVVCRSQKNMRIWFCLLQM